MKGIIVIWSGAVLAIPTGWHLCDGTEGTPDLRNRFVVGAGSTYAPAATGGNTVHSHTGNTDPTEGYLAPGELVAAGEGWSDTVNFAGFPLVTNQQNHLPPYYALCYIMHL